MVASNVASQFNSIFNSPNPCSNKDRNIGILAGAVAGALLGHAIRHDRRGTLVGTALGAGIGGLIGHQMDQRRCTLYKIAQANHLKIATATITPAKLHGPGEARSQTIGLDIQLQNQGDEFEPGTARLTPKARRYFRQIAAQYTPGALQLKSDTGASAKQVQASRRKAMHHKVLIVGHSAETGDPNHDARLSEQRAKAVARVFAEAGVPPANIYYQGAGDTLPIASNATAQGQRENRRVQIVDVPSDSDLQAYLRGRVANAADFRATSAAVATPPAGTHRPASQSERPGQAQPSVSEARASRSVPSEAAKSRSKPAHGVPAPEVVHAQGSRHNALHVARSGYDFGGAPVQGSGKEVDLGAPITHSMFHIITEAHAGTRLQLGSCLEDNPHVGTRVRNLATGKPFLVRDTVAGFYGKPWVADINGNLVALTNTVVFKDAGSPIPRPKMLIYKDYHGGRNARPDFSATLPVNVYRGQKAILYRVFVHGPMQCLDLVVPRRESVGSGQLYYDKTAEQVYQSAGHFKLR